MLKMKAVQGSEELQVNEDQVGGLVKMPEGGGFLIAELPNGRRIVLRTSSGQDDETYVVDVYSAESTHWYEEQPVQRFNCWSPGRITHRVSGREQHPVTFVAFFLSKLPVGIQKKLIPSQVGGD